MSPTDHEGEWIGKVDVLNPCTFEKERSAFGSGAPQTTDKLARIDCAAWNFASHAQLSRIAPGNWRLHGFGRPIQFPSAGKRKLTRDMELPGNLGESRQNITEPWKVAGGGFAQRQAPCVAARTGTDGFRFKDGHGLIRVETADRRGGGQPCKPATDYRNVDGFRERGRSGLKIDDPGSLSPRRRVGCIGHAVTPEFVSCPLMLLLRQLFKDTQNGCDCLSCPKHRAQTFPAMLETGKTRSARFELPKGLQGRLAQPCLLPKCDV